MLEKKPKFSCTNCKQVGHGLIPLRQDLLGAIAARGERLCLTCIENRLGRLLNRNDLRAGPLTTWYEKIHELFNREVESVENTVTPEERKRILVLVNYWFFEPLREYCRDATELDLLIRVQKSLYEVMVAQLEELSLSDVALQIVGESPQSLLCAARVSDIEYVGPLPVAHMVEEFCNRRKERLVAEQLGAKTNG